MEKIAIIEIKSSYTKFTVATIGEGFFRVDSQMKDLIKIGEDINKDGFIKPARINEVLTILKGYKKFCKANKIEDIVAVATYCVRNAKNQKSFIDEVNSMLGFKIKVLSEEEESSILYGATISTLDVPKGVTINIGAEHINITAYLRRNILFYKTIDFGYATLIDEKNEMDAKSLMSKCFNAAKDAVAKIEELKNIDNEFVVVGVGEMMESFGRLVTKNIKKYSLDLLHGYTFEKATVSETLKFLTTIEIDKTKKLRGISENRADYVAAAFAMLGGFLEGSQLENGIISQSGLTNGILFNSAQAGENDKVMTDVIGYWLDSSVFFNQATKANCHQVYTLSMLLFKQFRVLHKLPRTYVRSLRVASFMHDSGLRINHKNHEKNSFPVIMGESIYGLSHREHLVAAFISAGQIASDLSVADFTRYRDVLTDEDIDAIKKLAVIVRIAEALDCCHNNIVTDINCDVLGDSIILKVICSEDAALEIKEATAAAVDFKRAYKKNIEIL